MSVQVLFEEVRVCQPEFSAAGANVTSLSLDSKWGQELGQESNYCPCPAGSPLKALFKYYRAIQTRKLDMPPNCRGAEFGRDPWMSSGPTAHLSLSRVTYSQQGSSLLCTSRILELKFPSGTDGTSRCQGMSQTALGGKWLLPALLFF